MSAVSGTPRDVRLTHVPSTRDVPNSHCSSCVQLLPIPRVSSTVGLLTMDHSATPIRWRARQYTLPVRERVLGMGVLNVTPDSFSDGGRDLSVEAAVSRAEVVEEDVRDFRRSRVEAAMAAGIEGERIAVDPGFGFGKTSDHNLALLGSLPALRGLDRPIVIGPSRKSFVGAILGRPVEEREWGTAAAVAVGVFQGAHVVRAHSVAQMRDVTRVAQALRDAGRAPDRRDSFSAS